MALVNKNPKFSTHKEHVSRFSIHNIYNTYDNDIFIKTHKSLSVRKHCSLYYKLPDYVSTAIYKFFNISIENSYSYSYNVVRYTFVVNMLMLHCNIFNKMKNDYFIKSIKIIFESFFSDNKLFIDIINNAINHSYEDFIKQNIIVHNFNNYTCIDMKIFKILLCDNVIIIYNNKDYVCFDENKILFIFDKTILYTYIDNITEDKCNVSAYCNYNMTKNFIKVESSENYEYFSYNYHNIKTNNKYHQEYIGKHISNSIEPYDITMEKIVKHNNITTYYKDNKIEKLISRYMDNDNNSNSNSNNNTSNSNTSNSNGTYISTKEGDNKNILLKLNDKIIFNKNNNDILVDCVSVIQNEYVIAWKVCKSIDGENRIVKLGIPPDAIRVLPIGDDFFATFRKERCSKAFVLDIQEPILEKHISVVPREKVAYSYLFDKITEYNIGTIVVPDSFDDDKFKSCANGIHYHRDRTAVFKMWIPGFENIKYEY